MLVSVTTPDTLDYSATHLSVPLAVPTVVSANLPMSVTALLPKDSSVLTAISQSVLTTVNTETVRVPKSACAKLVGLSLIKAAKSHAMSM